MEERKIIRQHLVISGQVQGVGFRYRASYAAQSLGLTGWVRNEWDGTVEMEVQGSLSDINKMLEQVGRGSYVIIDSIKRSELPVDEYERGFHIE